MEAFRRGIRRSARQPGSEGVTCFHRGAVVAAATHEGRATGAVESVSHEVELYAYSALRIRSLSFIPRAKAKRLATSTPTLTFPNSIELMYVR